MSEEEKKAIEWLKIEIDDYNRVMKIVEDVDLLDDYAEELKICETLLNLIERKDKELETYKKVAKKLADTILEIDAEEEEVYEKICKNLPSLRCDEIEEGRCDKCIIEWARKEVDKSE